MCAEIACGEVVREVAASGEAAAAFRLDQREENRERAWTPLRQTVEPGEFVAVACRAGGPFDPQGCRSADVKRADDLVALVDALPGRWLLITLTVDRDAWTCPEAAYARCNERVREVARVVSTWGIHATALELQGKTGEGWPHWHLIVYRPDDVSIEHLAAKVRRAWRVRTEHVCQDTGEVSSASMDSIGFSDVKEARDRRGIARYTAKYLMKAWPAVPDWMGESRRQLRKLRISDACFTWLENNGRHHRHRGSRRVACRRRRRARALFDRMADSGSRHVVFKRDGDRLTFVRTLPVPVHPAGIAEFAVAGAEVVPSSGGRLRWKLSPAALQALIEREQAHNRMRDAFIVDRRQEFKRAWDLMQWERARDDELRVCGVD